MSDGAGENAFSAARTDDAESIEEALRALSTSEDPEAAARELAARLLAATRGEETADEPDTNAVPAAEPIVSAEVRPFTIFGWLLALLSAAGMAAALTLLYRGTAVIMETEGGFVASGGPYVIAHPAPDWIWIVPVSILSLFLFGGINIAASSRGWGFNAILFAWMGLFISLGWNFLRLGFGPPEGLQGAWGWILCGIVFWAMGFAPLLLIVSAFRTAFGGFVERQQNAGTRRAWATPSAGDTTGAYLAAQVLGVVLGIWGGVALFAAVAG